MMEGLLAKLKGKRRLEIEVGSPRLKIMGRGASLERISPFNRTPIEYVV